MGQVMQRREFLKFSGAATMGAALPWTGAPTAADAADGWREFEVDHRGRSARRRSRTKFWVPMPLDARDRPTTGRARTTGRATSTAAVDSSSIRSMAPTCSTAKSDGAGCRCPRSSLPTASRRVTAAVDLATPSREVVTLNCGRARALPRGRPSMSPPTASSARRRARSCSARARCTDKARAIYEWIVDNTLSQSEDARLRHRRHHASCSSPATLGGKCADLNALFVGLARAVRHPGARRLRRARRRVEVRLQAAWAARATSRRRNTAARSSSTRLRLGAGGPGRRAQGGARGRGRDHPDR